MKFYSPSIRQIDNTIEDQRQLDSLWAMSSEKISFVIKFENDKEKYFTLGKNRCFPWWGLSDTFRIDVEGNIDGYEVKPKLSFIGDVLDDDDKRKGEILYKTDSAYYDEDFYIFCELEFEKSSLETKSNPSKSPSDSDTELNSNHPKANGDSNGKIEVRVYSSNSYDDERLIETQYLPITLSDFNFPSPKDGSFFLDLWQHPTSWARYYDVDFFSKAHYQIIDSYIEGMAELGQRVSTIVLTDMPWAGQKCYEVEKNPSRLYEYKMVGLRKKNGEFKIDFTPLDTYMDICRKHGIDKEINLFGLIGNWDRIDFGSPVKDYVDPMRVEYFDEDENIYKFIDNRADLKTYLSAVFNHIYEKYSDRQIYVFGDQPSTGEFFRDYEDFLRECAGRDIEYKYALINDDVWDQVTPPMNSYSLNSKVMSRFCGGNRLTGKIAENAANMTWYSCCFPQTLNTFIKSDLMESRLVGWYTYYFGFKGFLRWAYAIYTEDPYEDVRYKDYKWAAGDMFFVYPGKDLAPVKSMRERNLYYGISDFEFFKAAEKIIGRDAILNVLDEILGKGQAIKRNGDDIIIQEILDERYYIKAKKKIYDLCHK